MVYQPTVKLTDEELIQALAAGQSMGQIAEKYDITVRTLFRRKARLNRELKIPPLSNPVPEGFEVTKLSTRLNEHGKEVGQNVTAKPIPLEPEMGDLVPEGHYVKGLSSFIVDGEVRAQWIKTNRDAEQQEATLQAAIRVLAEGLPPWPTLPEVPAADADLLNLYTLTDCHVGMMAWGRETGEPWDIRIAEQTLTETFLRMISAAPAAQVGVVNQLGDFLHFDGLMSVTPTSGHVLDADSRYQKVVEVAVRVLERIIHAAAQKHPIVRVFMHEGNHDMAGSVWLRVLFARLFRDNPRIIVEETPNPYVALQHGKTFLGFHHGHLTKLDKLPLIFAEQHSKMWGETKFRYVHTGHMHHVHEKEHPGIRIEQHATIAAKDAYAARGGWHSVRQATSRTYHAAYGEVARATFLPLEAA